MKALLLALALSSAGAPQRELRVCADPNNMPFSNAARQGFENKLVELVAADLGAKVTYVWWAQRRGNVRETLNAGLCDLIPGVASSLEMLATTQPYYRSTYVAVTRADRNLAIASFDDPRLPDLKIGVHLIGDDGSNPPPAHALMRRGMIDNVRGYMIYGDYDRPDPQKELIDALVSGEIDVAFVWGPVAGYFARHASSPLAIQPISPHFDGPQLPMIFDISMGVRKNDPGLRAELDELLSRRKTKVRTLLADYGIPIVSD
jgi:mxaJ protein